MAQSKVSGVLPVYKPEGWTSFDVVARIRSITGIKKIGHGGTLDPMASGVLPVFVGRASRACDIVPDNRKRYIAGFRLGETSDTLDSTGTVTGTSQVRVTEEELSAVLPEFVGKQMQIPPMYSAIKVDGKKLYEYAREGKTVELEARPIVIDDISLRAFDEKKQAGIIEIGCRKGTYIRALIRDIAVRLGTAGLMTDLERTFSGGFSLDDCYTLAEINEAENEGELSQIVIPTDRIFELYDSIKLGAYETRLYKNGVRLRTEQVGMAEDEKLYRVYGFDGEFLGLGRFFFGQFGSYKNFFEV